MNKIKKYFLYIEIKQTFILKNIKKLYQFKIFCLSKPLKNGIFFKLAKTCKPYSYTLWINKNQSKNIILIEINLYIASVVYLTEIRYVTSFVRYSSTKLRLGGSFY